MTPDCMSRQGLAVVSSMEAAPLAAGANRRDNKNDKGNPQ
eukprot:gene6342-7352_t